MSLGSSSGVNVTAADFGRTYVVEPKGKHTATVVWLHGLGDTGASWSQLLETLPLPNIKWICPTAPTRPLTVFGGSPATAWFDVADLSEDAPEDVEGLDASATYVENLLSAEPAGVKLGVGGFSMGAGTALYSATCCALGQYGNGKQYDVKLSAVVGLSGWLPCAKNLEDKIASFQDAARRASCLPLLLCHGKADEFVLYKSVEKSVEALKSAGFQRLNFKTYPSLGHFTIPQEMEDVCQFLTASLELDGSQS